MGSVILYLVREMSVEGNIGRGNDIVPQKRIFMTVVLFLEKNSEIMLVCGQRVITLQENAFLAIVSRTI